ncbi:M48 family metallopeptidase [candidate division KSB1 bacterium]|nr:M48 family metallopeptidase [candidate division KSB1 bacterium]
MNLYAAIILGTFLVDFLLNLIADLLNLKNLSSELPAEFKDIYEAEKYKKSQKYTVVNTRFGLIISTFSLVVTLVFWFTGGFNLLDITVRRWGFAPIWNGLLYIGILLLARFILSLPFNIYATFVIEERFGFNKTTPAVFFADTLKSLGLALSIGGLLLAGILAFFQYAGSLAWLYCWLVTTIFTILLQYIAPTWIMPMFNKFEPLQEGELRDRILEYAKSVKFSLRDIFIMDGSKRSKKSNAFFTGFGRNKRIALFDTLVQQHTVNELVAVLAHEIGHFKKKHILVSMAISILHMGVMFFLLSIFISQKGLFDAFYMQNISIYAGMLFFAMLYSPIELILSIFMNIFSRKNEYQADRFAVETFPHPESFISALKKLVANNLGNLTPHPVYVFFNYSHPPVLQRILKIRETVNK